jgi:hypothetical protein
MPIKLKEILNRLYQEEKNDGLTELDNWKITDYDFMTDMDFKPDGLYHFSMKKPHMTVAHKRGVGFVVEDYSKTNKTEGEAQPDTYDNPHREEQEENAPAKLTFPTFKELTEYFTKYEQRWENQPYKS